MTRLPRLMVTALACALVVAVGGCEDERDSQPPVDPSTSTPATTPATTDPTVSSSATSPMTTEPSPAPTDTATRPPTDLSQYDIAGFSLDGGNTACLFSRDGGVQVRCDIRDRDWEPPPAPADCAGDYGTSTVLGKEGEFGCVSDTVFEMPGETDGTRELPEGDSVTYDDLRCDAIAGGVQCVNTKTEWGFILTRAKAQIF